MKETILKWFEKNYNEIYTKMDQITHSLNNGNLNPFHMEGTILKHTKMVLEWLDSEDLNLIFACILHDIGKIHTREEKNSKVYFRKHENISTYLSIDILNEAKKEFDIDIVKILKLIAWHGTLWLRNQIPLEEHFKVIDYKYGHDLEFYKDFLTFVEADALGRELKNKEDEDNILEQMYLFNNYMPFNTLKFREVKNKDVIFLIGLSGSGKSTYIKDKYKDFTIISVDNILNKGKLDYDFIDYKKNVKKAFNLASQNMRESIKKEENIIVDMTNLDKEKRRRKLSLFPSTKYNKKAIVFLTGLKKIKENLNKRKGKSLSLDIILKQMEDFELPNFDEFDKIDFIL